MILSLHIHTMRAMVDKLLELPQYTLSTLASNLGVHRQTLCKLKTEDNYQLLPEKQLALIKLYCAMSQG